VTNYIRIAALVLVGLLTFVSFVFINNTIGLAISARRREIAIERLVGASNSFIRGPFVAEGILEALLGSALAVAALHFGMGELVPRLESSLQFLSFTLPQRVVLETYAGLVLGGLVLGTFGSSIAMRRYLRV
jgi:cell division transport system permease protein